MPSASAARESRTLRLLVWIPIVVALLDDLVYVALIWGQPDRAPDAYTVPFVAAFIGLMAVLLGVSLLDHPRVASLRPALRAGAAAGLIVLGVLGAFSIGLPLLVAGGLAAGAAFRTLVGRGVLGVVYEISAAAVVLAILVIGFEVTARIIVCPGTGSGGGQWPGIVTHGFSWECVGGQARFT